MTRDSRESVLSRWSRRKLEADQLAPAIEESVPPESEAGLTMPAIEEVDAVDKPVLTDADMPDIESLNGVSDELRNLALRKLFKAPVFNIRDGLDEYDEDYTYFEKLGDIVTCDMKHQIEMQEQKLREAQAAEAEAAGDDEIEEIEDDEMEAMEARESSEDEVEAEIDEQPPATLAQAEQESRPRQESDDD
jgi:hypothetical protein